MREFRKLQKILSFIKNSDDKTIIDYKKLLTEQQLQKLNTINQQSAEQFAKIDKKAQYFCKRYMEKPNKTFKVLTK